MVQSVLTMITSLLLDSAVVSSNRWPYFRRAQGSRLTCLWASACPGYQFARVLACVFTVGLVRPSVSVLSGNSGWKISLPAVLRIFYLFIMYMAQLVPVLRVKNDIRSLITQRYSTFKVSDFPFTLQWSLSDFLVHLFLIKNSLKVSPSSSISVGSDSPARDKWSSYKRAFESRSFPCCVITYIACFIQPINLSPRVW